MGIDAIALQKVYQIVKNSDKMSKGLETAENAINVDKNEVKMQL